MCQKHAKGGFTRDVREDRALDVVQLMRMPASRVRLPHFAGLADSISGPSSEAGMA